MSTLYINTPFQEDEYAAIEEMARKEGRSKGQQLRALALAALKLSTRRPAKKKARAV